MKETIFISGLYSGPSPSAGLGVARSLRTAFPSARLVGVDYWAGSSGLQHEVFDATWLKPPWDLMEPELYAQEIQAELERGAFWISTLDLEVEWLARSFEPHMRLLSPSLQALTPTQKPRPTVASLLPFATAPSLDLTASDEAIYAFCRAHSWPVWLKGPYHDAIAVKNWHELEEARAKLAKKWHTRRLSIQAHVRGYEESICFVASNGEVLDAVYMRKRITTPEGKTWAGRLSDLPPDRLAALESAVQAIGWTGGAEVELIRDVDGQLWLLEWNPRFPAWVHGVTLSGRNLPATLMQHVLGLPRGPRTLSQPAEFTRVVLEVPVRADLPLPLPVEPEHGQVGAFGKYGAAIAAIVPKLSHSREERPPDLPTISREAEMDLEAAVSVDDTPQRLFLQRAAKAAFARLDRNANSTNTAVRYAYSLKTSPDPQYLELARKAGMLAECISLLEVRQALEAGWPPEAIVLNGPGKWWPRSERAADGLRAVFCDSIEELEWLQTTHRTDRLWGLRLRIPSFPSRFGVPVEEPAAFERVAACIAALPPERGFGVHVHMASTMVGMGHWRDIVESAVVWGAMLESTTGRKVRVLDLGGGYHPDDFATLPFGEIADFARQSLRHLAEVVVEPGRALTQATMAVVTRVLDVRRQDGRIDEIVVDTCIAELPLAGVYPHRFFRVAGPGRIEPIGRGPVRVFGRICMEDDIVSTGLDLSEDLKVGDRLVICDAGGYERSMSYAFGRGGYA
jgi:diaminopimelate decarboxylase